MNRIRNDKCDRIQGGGVDAESTNKVLDIAAVFLMKRMGKQALR